jgi:hypothetical protein
MAAAYEGHPFVACDREFLFSETISPQASAWFGEHRDKVRRRFAPRRFTSPEEYADEVLGAGGFNLVGEPPVTLIHRTMFDRFGPFNPLLVQHCDSEFWNRIGVNVGLRFVDEPLATFRVHADSTSARNAPLWFRSKKLEQIVELHEMLFNSHYAPLRAAAARARPPRNLSKQFEEQLHAATALARWTSQPPQCDTRLKEELSRMTVALPNVRVSEWRHAVWRLKVRLGLVDAPQV